MREVSLEEASTHLSQLIREAGTGEEVILTENSLPVAKLVPLSKPRSYRQPGSAKGLILHIADDFDAPLDDFKEYMP